MLNIDLVLEGKDFFRSEFPGPKGSWKLEWRLLSIKEYKIFATLRANETMHPFFIYKKVFDRCYIGDLKLLSNFMPLFIPITLGQLIMYLSGDSNVETMQNDIALARMSYDQDDIYELMKRVICSAFPSQSWDDLEKLNKFELITKFTISESLLVYKTSGAYVPIDLSKLTRRDLINREEETEAPLAIDFDGENEALVPKLDPFELEAHGFEHKKMSTDLARKLDKLRR